MLAFPYTDMGPYLFGTTNVVLLFKWQMQTILKKNIMGLFKKNNI